ncbi:MAG TPA: glycosyltransferase [Thermodesulfobacteriota bacterium]|nr:glycosyltransferase [Thermodesulfobacteriota bacterium]
MRTGISSLNTLMNELSTPFVSVIIPVFDDLERLNICLQALEHQTYPKSLYEVIVVDNGSVESVEPIVTRFSRARTSYESRPSQFAARNRGISLAKGEVIAFTDADCIPSPDWIERGVANLLRVPNSGLVAGKIETFFKNQEHPTAVELYENLKALPQKRYIEVGRFGATANLFTFRRVFEHVGLFDDETRSSGDVEWGQRVSSFGYELIYADDSRVAHPARYSFVQLYKVVARKIGGVHDWRQHFNYGRRFLLPSGAYPTRPRTH